MCFSFVDTKQQSLLFQIDYPEITDNIVPKHRFMSGFEQHVETPDRRWQYLLFAAEPYETIAFKVFSFSLFFIISFLFLDSKS
jgi:splicing factor 3A subunit 2